MPSQDNFFDATLRRHGTNQLRRSAPEILQINVGKQCNQACHHCHVDAGPARREMMTAATAARVIQLIEANPSLRCIDLTGGAPELNPNFAHLVAAARKSGREVIIRCNLTVLFEPKLSWLPEFYQTNQVRLVCSLPCYTAENVAKQRGAKVFEKSIEALIILNQFGFGTNDLVLDLVYNPVGPTLPPSQAELEAQYRLELETTFGIRFNRLLTITNMPISRFALQLAQWGRQEEYMALLINHFNPATIPGLMCRNLISISYDGNLYDCDFNQMLDIPLSNRSRSIWQIEDFNELDGAPIATGSHCFGCTAGAGSSCGGALSAE